jgi:hypothetical protein
LPEVEVKTEGQAAERIAELTTLVLEQSARPADVVPAQPAPGLLPAPKRTAKRAATHRKKKPRAKRTTTRTSGRATRTRKRR